MILVSCRATHSCRRDPPRLPALAEITCVSQLPTPPGTLILKSDFLPMPEAEKRFQSDDLAALLVANLPPDAQELRLCLDWFQINLLRDARQKRSFTSAAQVHVPSQSPRTDNDEVMDGQPWVNENVTSGATMVSTSWE